MQMYPVLLMLLCAKVLYSQLWQLGVNLCSPEALQGRVLEDGPMPLLFCLRGQWIETNRCHQPYVTPRASTPE